MLRHAMDVMSLTFFEEKTVTACDSDKLGWFEGAVVSLFALDSRRVVKYVDAVSNCRLMDCLPSFVLEVFTNVSVKWHVFSGFE